MRTDSQRELNDLTAVQSFYIGILEKSLGHSVPLPAAIAGGDASAENCATRVQALRNWLDVLDLAMAPPLLRDSLKSAPTPETAYCLLRYFADKCSVRSGDRDKMDCVITQLFRTPPQVEGASAPAWQRPEVDSSYFFVAQAALGFLGHLYKLMADLEYERMTPEQTQLMTEFEYLYQELEEFRHFDQIMDSNIVQRVREIKQSLGKSFYHPDALAHLAVWNDVFGRKFDELFHDATTQIRTFAENVQKEGASVLSRLEGDVTVQQLTEVQPGEILAGEYQKSQDDFRKVSKFKKVVDNKRTGRGAAPQKSVPVAAPAPAPVKAIPTAPNTLAMTPSSQAQPASPAVPMKPAAPAVRAEVLAIHPSQAVHNAVQEGKIHNARESIKEHVRSAADSKMAYFVTIKKTRITLTPAELEAFRADYQGEKSFRADYATVMMNVVAYLSRMIVEVDEYNQRASSAYLWKPHADALAYLLSTLERLNMEATSVLETARARGLQEKAGALQASLDKLRDYARTVSQTLQAAGQGAGV